VGAPLFLVSNLKTPHRKHDQRPRQVAHIGTYALPGGGAVGVVQLRCWFSSTCVETVRVGLGWREVATVADLGSTGARRDICRS
jgi:hypothetical protein